MAAMSADACSIDLSMTASGWNSAAAVDVPCISVDLAVVGELALAGDPPACPVVVMAPEPTPLPERPTAAEEGEAAG